MKKTVAILLCLSVVFCLFGCENKTGKSQIDLGGNLGKIAVEGDAYGDYKVIETPKEFTYEDWTDVTVYEDLNCDSPYIAVYRKSKGSDTLESIVKKDADLYSYGYYQMFENSDDAISHGGYICSYEVYDGKFYYVDSNYMEDGDNVVCVDIYAKTEEIRIGNSDVYAYVPVGYTDKLNDDYRNHSTVFCGTYTEDYYFADTWIGKWSDTYEYLSWLWGDYYPNGLPITEEQYSDLIDRYYKGDDVMEEYYSVLGNKLVFDSTTNKAFECDYEGCYYVLEDGVEAWFKVGEDWYFAWFESDLDPKPAFASVFLLSLHEKKIRK